ncbi:hypothetical protein AURDEDRAFT_75282 [Auricularia subglabra TFB-10046 SS5]|uniref:Uncharacterized protein n=1 Tax=Auricularia subglabra (strain TFB-10046 / SS5) TaxID=717982 RepID=J0WTA3_AURST|nr:hypothetical protein AURDEDRAFT_75282 [Auricularia subglabra TFB-10046 SS5]
MQVANKICSPLLADKCLGVCSDCIHDLSRRRVPKFAIANGMWIGEVPAVLKRLNYAEKLLVARSRHHKCLVRIAKSGMNRLNGNMICYPNPYPKLYHVLPPHRDDIDELLAIVFTGSSRPLDSDMKRVPFVIRRNVVIDALNWLKLNNYLYNDIIISEQNIESYEDAGLLPVAVPEVVCTSNNPVESRAANDNEESVGVSEGECVFSVAGAAYDLVSSNNYKAITAIAAKHMLSGKALAVPHGPVPDTLWSNSDLFPNMFPWLFPYGVGGICNSNIQGEMSEHAHKKHLLMYYDKRFQNDKEFALLAFNQEQIIKGSEAGSFLSSKSKFNSLAERILNINENVFGEIANRLRMDPSWRPSNPEEHDCFRILSDLDMVNAHVPGSVASKRYQRNELWSMMSYLGAPTWFITFAPSDTRHPLSLYYAGSGIPYDQRTINLLSDSAKWGLIANNAVPSARFFHFVVNLFIDEILRWKKEEPGLFGHCSGFYGTVEQQGRLTLHLHLLLWLQANLSPEDIRRRLLDPTSNFQQEMISYLEQCHRGNLSTSTVRDAKLNFESTRVSDSTYENPLNHLPVPVDNSPDGWQKFNTIVDDLLCRTNHHKCDSRCYIKSPLCKSRFPRKIVDMTHVDSTGYIHMKHGERYMNTINPTMSYLLRCNTDVTCLLSGTSIKAVMAYATDYITKVGLKTPSMFQLIRNQLIRNKSLLESTCARSDKRRKIITGIINSFTSKSEIGAPMAASYLLDLPDHYTSHEFKTIYWRGFVSEVLSCFPDASADRLDDVPTYNAADYNVFVSRGSDINGKPRLVPVSPVMDYMMRPVEHENYCLYDWIRLSNKSTRRADSVTSSSRTSGPINTLAIGQGISDERLYSFIDGHSQADTHTVRMDNSRANVIPNFVGGSLPRRDAGDREYYCCTMLTLFKPWRAGTDLKHADELWDCIFEQHPFSPRGSCP